MKPGLTISLSMASTLGVLVFGCTEGKGTHVSPCEETVTSDEPLVVHLTRSGNDTEIDFDAAEVHMSYSDRPGDEACVFDAQVVLSKGGAQGCTLTLETAPFLENGDGLVISHVVLSVNDACPTWGFAEPTTLDATIRDPENTVDGFGSIYVPDLVDEDDSCYAGEVRVSLFTAELSGMMAVGPASLSFFVDVETTPESLPCAMP